MCLYPIAADGQVLLLKVVMTELQSKAETSCIRLLGLGDKNSTIVKLRTFMSRILPVGSGDEEICAFIRNLIPLRRGQLNFQIF